MMDFTWIQEDLFAAVPQDFPEQIQGRTFPTAPLASRPNPELLANSCLKNSVNDCHNKNTISQYRSLTMIQACRLNESDSVEVGTLLLGCH